MPELFSPDIDQRRTIRFDTHLQALVTNDWQEHSVALVSNISHDGIRIEGSRALVDIIFPNFNPGRPARRHSLSLRLALEEGMKITEENSVTLSCNSVYVLRQRQDWFQLGLIYSVIDAATEVRLEQFILELQHSEPR
tara:strand:+ start:13828 stop:14241 length:414 start_codon:yes stop_codon:yes gene_type:complete